MPPKKSRSSDGKSSGKSSSDGKPGGKKPSARIAANGFRLPEPIAAGEILSDMTQKEWRIGKSIGVGGFGEIYLASDDIEAETNSSNADYCVKVEPHSNGPLFTEMHCYMRVAKPDDIETWKEEHQKPRLGMPKYMGSGSHIFSDNKYRFMVMERFGSDLQKIFEKNNKKFSLKTTYQLGIQIIDVLEYVHSKEYIHADIKASNLLLGHQPGTEDQVFLVDYGLACRYANDGRHKEYRYDGRKAHDGTMEFTSRDAHIGAHSRRGDLEILGFNMVQWLCSKLPWEDNLADSDYVATMKRGYMDDIPLFMDKCFGDDIPPGLEEYLEYVKKLSFDDQPNYNKLRKILTKALASRGFVDDGHIDFTCTSPKAERKVQPRINKKTRRGSKRIEGEENIPELAPKKVVRRSSQMSPCRQRNRVLTRTSSQYEVMPEVDLPSRVRRQTSLQCEDSPKVEIPNRVRRTRSYLPEPEDTPKDEVHRVRTRTVSQNEEVPMEEVSLSSLGITGPFPNLDDEDEMILKEQQRMETRRRSRPAKIEIRRDTSLDNPTPQMIELINKIREKTSSPAICQKRHRHNSNCKGSGNMSPAAWLTSTSFTPEMKAVMKRREERNLFEDSVDNSSIMIPSVFDSESESSNDSVDINYYNTNIGQSPPAIRAIIRQSPPHIRTFFASVPSTTYMNDNSDLRNLETPSPTADELDSSQEPDADKLHPLLSYEDARYTYPSPPLETDYPTIPENEAPSRIVTRRSSLKSNQNCSNALGYSWVQSAWSFMAALIPAHR